MARSTRARLAGSVLAGLRVVCLRSSGSCSCGVVGSRSSWPPYGRLGLRGFHCAAAGGCSAACCLCSWHVRVGAGQWRRGLSKCSVVYFVTVGWSRLYWQRFGVLLCSWVPSSVGVAHHGVADPLGAVSVSTRAGLAGSALAGLRVVCLRSSGGCSCGVVGAWLSWPPHGRLGSCGFRCAAACGLIVQSCPFSQHVCVCVGLWRLGLYKCRVV